MKKKAPLDIEPHVNPRGRIHNWREVYKKIVALHKSGFTLESSIASQKIAYATYWQFKKRMEKEEGVKKSGRK